MDYWTCFLLFIAFCFGAWAGFSLALCLGAETGGGE